MILTDECIKRKIESGAIVVTPLKAGAIGTNSIDVHLAKTLMTYDNMGRILDAGKAMDVDLLEIPAEGLVLHPGTLYLGVTKEYTETHEDVPILEGKSSVGRLGINIHCTAGFGDVGFCGHWTLEIFVVQPIRVYAGMPIGQIVYHAPLEKPKINYTNPKRNSTYVGNGEQHPIPVPSKLWQKINPVF